MYTVETYYIQTGDFEREIRVKTLEEVFTTVLELRNTICKNDHNLHIKVWQDNKNEPIAWFDGHDE